MPMSFPAILLLNARSIDDPALQRVRGRWAVGDCLEAFVRLGYFARVIVSVPPHLPEAVAAVLDGWDFETHRSTAATPAARLAGVFSQFDLSRAFVLTGYNSLLEQEAVARAIQISAGETFDCIYTPATIPAKHFCLMGRRAVDYLHRETAPVLSPFKFVDKLLAAKHTFTLHRIDGQGYHADEALLWNLLAGEQAAYVPAPLIRELHAACPAPRRYERDTIRRALAQYCAGDDWQWLARYFEQCPDLLPYVRLLADQIAWFNRWQAHIDDGPGRFLEIGFGVFPLVATLLLAKFDAGTALDIRTPKPKLHRDAITFVLELIDRLPNLVALDAAQRRKMTAVRVAAKLSVIREDLHHAAFAPKTFDFICSRGVLCLVKDIAPFLQRMAALVTPGGQLLHQIPFNRTSPAGEFDFRFLAHSPRQWAAKAVGGNNWRINDYVTALEELGFSVTVRHRFTASDYLAPQTLHPHWAAYDPRDLYCATAVIDARKSKDAHD